MVPQGGNTGLAGACVPHDLEVILTLHRMNHILQMTPVRFCASQHRKLRLAGAAELLCSLHEPCTDHSSNICSCRRIARVYEMVSPRR